MTVLQKSSRYSMDEIPGSKLRILATDGPTDRSGRTDLFQCVSAARLPPKVSHNRGLSQRNHGLGYTLILLVQSKGLVFHTS